MDSITPLVILVIVLSVLLCFMDSDYPSGIFWSLCCLSFFVLWIHYPSDNTILITKIYSDYPSEGSFFVLSESIKQTPLKDCVVRFWLPLWYILNCVVCPSLFYGFWLPLWYLLVIVLSVLLCFMDSDYPMTIYTRGVIRIHKTKKDRQHNDQNISEG